MAWEVGMMKTGMRAAVLLLVLLAASSGAARGQGAQ